VPQREVHLIFGWQLSGKQTGIINKTISKLIGYGAVHLEATYFVQNQLKPK
jgi:hypothetical protein